MRRSRSLSPPALIQRPASALIAFSLALGGCASSPDPVPPEPAPRPAVEETLPRDVPRSEQTVLEALWDAEKKLRAQREEIRQLEAEVARLRTQLREKESAR